MPYFRFGTSQLVGYTTTFPLTENPISEGGKWLNGATDGIAWQNMQTGSGNAYGTGASPSDTNDNVASLIGYPANHYVQATIFRAGGYSPAIAHEVELLVRCTITANNIKAYEFLMNSAGAFDVVRWNGPLNSFDSLTFSDQNGGPTAVVDGDVIRIEAVGSNFTMKQNGIIKRTWTDATHATGNPAMGAFWRPDASIVPSSFGFKDFAAGAL